MRITIVRDPAGFSDERTSSLAQPADSTEPPQALALRNDAAVGKRVDEQRSLDRLVPREKVLGGGDAPEVDADSVGDGHIQDRQRDRQPAARLDHAIEEAAVGPVVAGRIAEDSVPLGKAFHEQPEGLVFRPRSGDRAGKFPAARVEPLERGPKVQTGLGVARNSSETNVRSTSARRVNSLRNSASHA